MRLISLVLMLCVSGCAGSGGADGADGMTGPRGATGMQGEAGPAGPRGDTGPAGPMGEMGAPGKSATAADGGMGYEPSFSGRCISALDLVSVDGSGNLSRTPDGTTETALDYAFVIYSNNDVEVQCDVSLGSAQDGTGSDYYPSVTNGAQSAACIAHADYPSSGKGEVGYWTLDLLGATPLAPEAIYTDPDNPIGLNGFKYNFTSADCHLYKMTTGGTWETEGFSAVF